MRKILRDIVLRRLEKYASLLIETHQPKIIAITGSVGKTSTKHAIAQVLAPKYQVLYREGNYNTEFGLPLSLFELDAPENTTNIKAWLNIFKSMRQTIDKPIYPYDVVVLEMGADKPGDIERFMRYIQPDIGVVTAVAKVHMEEFRSVEAILEEKWLLAASSRKVFYNHDDANLQEKARDHREAYGYGLSETDYWTDMKSFDEAGAWNVDFYLKDSKLDARLPVVAPQSIYSLTVAAAIADCLGVGQDDILQMLSEWKQPPGRMRILYGRNQSTILDDSYNASPYATVAALAALQQFSGRKLAILGSMNELGEYEEEGHRLVGKHSKGLDILATIGYAANKYLIPAAIAAGADEAAVHECNTPYEAGSFIAGQLKPGDVVLVKGSQNGVFAEEAIKWLLLRPEDEAQLVRQSEQWLAVKHSQFGPPPE